MPKPKQKRSKSKQKDSDWNIPSSTDNSSGQPCPVVVGIGASAGGLNAFKTFFSKMPADSGMAFVLVPHLDPTHKSLMVELLAKQTEMVVCEVEDEMAVEPNRLYVIPPDNYLTMRDGKLHLVKPTEPRGLQTAIDSFFRSLAEDRQETAIGIILSGTSSHGTIGLQAIKAAGGMAMVQDPDTADYDHMPQNAIATGIVDFILPPEAMPEALIKYVQHAYVGGVWKPAAPPETEGDQLGRVLALLRARTKYDFRCYRKNMLLRRVQRRMGLNHIDRLPDYLELLRGNGDEVKHLFRDMLIGVTGFFREPEAYQVLEQRAIPQFVERNDEVPVRVWIPGCATGEEAYSIAILLIEQFTAAQKPLNVQIFATDIDEDALEFARQGIYPESIAADITAERLQRFFTQDNSHYHVNKQVRESVVFAAQNLISDAPFSKLDLISCRNLLIYLEPEVQRKVISLLHFALNVDGYLFLGSSETVGLQVDLFETASKKWRVFRRIGPTRRDIVDFPIVAGERRRRGLLLSALPAARREVNFAELTQRQLLEHYAPASVLINRKYEILYFHGPTGKFLEPPTGEPTQDLIAMAREGLRTRLRAACHKTVRDNQPVRDATARVKHNDAWRPCTINIEPIIEPKGAEGLLLVTFQDRENTPSAAPGAVAGVESEPVDESSLVRQLEYELKTSREDLQSTIEEMESSNEELKASNEEVMSMNEELQSANEELETSKEELQSLNEELSTVNNQLQDKVEELDKAHNDMTNLLNSSDIATLFLDTEMCIRQFTPAAGKLLGLIDSDQGRPIKTFATAFTGEELLADVRRVLDKLTPIETEVCTQDDTRFGSTERDEHADEGQAGKEALRSQQGQDRETLPEPEDRSYLRSILPYRTADNRIEGVVVTFVEITEQKQAKEQLEGEVTNRTQELCEREERLRAIMDNAAEAIVVIGMDGVITDFNPAAEELFGYTAGEVVGHNVSRLMPSPYREKHDGYLASYQKNDKSWIMDQPRELPGRRKDGAIVPLEITVTEIDHYRLYCGIIRDLSEQKALEREIADISTQERERIGQDIHDGIGQQLTGLSLLATSLKRRLAKKDLPEAAQLDEIIGLLQQSTEEARALSHGLAPVPITPQGLEDALRILAEDVQNTAGVNCRFESQQPVDIKDRTVAMQFYRIAQEAVNNAVKHAQAREITIKLRNKDPCELTISDDGSGFQIGEAMTNGFGLRIMRYRAGIIGCQLEIEATPGEGTIVRCRLNQQFVAI